MVDGGGGSTQVPFLTSQHRILRKRGSFVDTGILYNLSKELVSKAQGKHLECRFLQQRKEAPFNGDDNIGFHLLSARNYDRCLMYIYSLI